MPVRGAALNWSETDIDDIASLSIAQIQAAQSYWRQHAKQARRALDGDGDAALIARGLEAVIAASDDEAARLTQAVMAGQMDVADWQTAMAELVITVALCGLAAGKGGWAAVTADDLARLRDGDGT